MKIKNKNSKVEVKFMAVLTLTFALLAGAVNMSAQIVKKDKGIDITPDAGGRLVRPTIPVTPDVPNLPSELVNGVRIFRLTPMVFQHQLSTFPKQFAEVWGYNGSIPVRPRLLTKANAFVLL